MSVPNAVLAAGWIPFMLAIIAIVLLSFIYIRCYRHENDWNMCSLVIAFLGLAVTLATCALVPVDIFLISYMKDANGMFKPWAEDLHTQDSVENSLLYAYYVLFGCMVLFLFLLLPFAYFYSDPRVSGFLKKSFNGVKCSACFILLGFILFTVGAFVPIYDKPQNGTAQWNIVTTIFPEFLSSYAENAISFVMSVLMLAGMFPMIIYLGCGMAVWPIDLLKGKRSLRQEHEEIQEERLINRTEVECLRARQSLSRQDQRRLENLDERQHLIQRQEHHLSEVERSTWRRCSRFFCRPFEILFGILFLLLALLIFVSLLIRNIDKLMHSLGPRSGYILPSAQFLNPMDKVLLYTQKAFPLDYLVLMLLFLFLFFCAMATIEILGIRCCCVQIFRIRTNRTRPQGLILVCFLLMFVVLSLSVLVYQMAPQYGTFGSQKFIMNVTHPDGNVTTSVVPCSLDAVQLGDCVMTRMSVLLLRFIYRTWFFGAAYFWASWAFLGMFIVALIVSVFLKRRSSIASELDNDDEMIAA